MTKLERTPQSLADPKGYPGRRNRWQQTLEPNIDFYMWWMQVSKKYGQVILITDAAMMLGVTHTTVRNWTNMGRVRYIQRPGKRRIMGYVPLSDIVDLLEQTKSSKLIANDPNMLKRPG